MARIGHPYPLAQDCVQEEITVGDREAQVDCRLATIGDYKSVACAHHATLKDRRCIVTLDVTHYSSGSDVVKLLVWDGETSFQLEGDEILDVIRDYNVAKAAFAEALQVKEG